MQNGLNRLRQIILTCTFPSSERCQKSFDIVQSMLMYLFSGNNFSVLKLKCFGESAWDYGSQNCHIPSKWHFLLELLPS